ncbi:hypothetical protein B0920_02965 [Massilia sp. KIM]|nr:hypothetical protein B0920_02965 [Massilia sp. KIM]
MAEEGFFRRWARLKSTGGEPEPVGQASAPLPAAAPAALAPAPAPAEPGPADAAEARPLPTLEDAERLGLDSDFSGFVVKGVDQAVRRMALKKLFADPHFNVMDGLDVYIDDYNKPSPLSEDMLAQLRHAHSALGRLLDDGGKEEQAPETQAAERAPDREDDNQDAPAPPAQQAAPPSTQGNA